MLRKINLVCVGTLKKDYLNNIVKKYSPSINILNIKDSDIKKESYEILKTIEKFSNCILFDLKGEIPENKHRVYLNSVDEVTFIIGGSDGVSEEVKKRCRFKLKLSDFTYTHQMFRITSLMFISYIFNLK